MAYNGPGYIDVTQRPKQSDEECIVNVSDMRNRQESRNGFHSSEETNQRFPFCIVWTPIPLLTYFIPCLGHMGICKANGVIRDFAASYYVSEDNMAFGNPTKIARLDPNKVRANIDWDTAIEEAAQVYEHRAHNLCCDNCHSMVALALNKMQYDGKTNWNMVNVWFLFVRHSKYLGFSAAAKSLMPFLFILAFAALLMIFCIF